jgi:hypothetical protein
MPSLTRVILNNLAVVAFLVFERMHNHVSIPYVALMAIVLFSIMNVGMWLRGRAVVARRP